jgi:hypothetical protein
VISRNICDLEDKGVVSKAEGDELSVSNNGTSAFKALVKETRKQSRDVSSTRIEHKRKKKTGCAFLQTPLIPCSGRTPDDHHKRGDPII